MDEDFKLFMREMLLRFDKLLKDIEANTRAMEENFKQVHEEHGAQREALFRIFDQLDNGGAAA